MLKIIDIEEWIKYKYHPNNNNNAFFFVFLSVLVFILATGRVCKEFDDDDEVAISKNSMEGHWKKTQTWSCKAPPNNERCEYYHCRNFHSSQEQPTLSPFLVAIETVTLMLPPIIWLPRTKCNRKGSCCIRCVSQIIWLNLPDNVHPTTQDSNPERIFLVGWAD